MACLIKRDSNNNILKVEVRDNVESKLFNNIASTPHLDMDTSLEVYKNIYSKGFSERFGDWQNGEVSETVLNDIQEPELFFYTNTGVLTKSFETALNNTSEGVIKAGFVTTKDILVTDKKDLFEVANNDLTIYNGQYKLNNQQGFLDVLSIDSNSNPSTLNGFINNSIRNKELSPNKIKKNGRYVFKGYGETSTYKEYNGILVQQNALANLGLDSVERYSDGTFDLKEINKDSIELSTGDKTVVESKKKLKELLKQGQFKALAKKYKGFLSIAYSLFREDNSLFKAPSKVLNNTKNKEKDLRISLLNTLNKIGVKTISIADYLSNYNTRNNIDPSVEALADISKNIIAFAEGKSTVENLTEETAHFIIEGFNDQDAINVVLPLVEETVEWKENSQRYYNKYSEEFSGQELDNIVRREVLGKLLKNKILDNFNSQNESPQAVGVIQYLRNRWQEFLQKIRSLYVPTLRKDLDKVLNELSDKVLNEEVHEFFDTNLLKNSKFTLFSLNDKKDIITIRKAIQKLEERLKKLQRSKDIDAEFLKNDVNNIVNSINNLDEWSAIKLIISSLEPQVKKINKQLDKYEKIQGDSSNIAYFTPEEIISFENITEDFVPILQELRTLINVPKDNVEESDRLTTIDRVKDLLDSINILKGRQSLQVLRDNNSIANRVMSDYNISEQQREFLESEIDKDLKEISWFQRNFGSLRHASNQFLGILSKIIKNNSDKVNRRYINDITPFLNKIDKLGFDLTSYKALKESQEGEGASYFKSPYKWGKFIEAELKAMVSAYNKTQGTKLSVEDYKLGLKASKIKKKSDFSEQELKEFRSLMNDWYSKNTERRYLNEFYQRRDSLYKNLDISLSTQEVLSNLSRSRYLITSKYLSDLKEGERLDYSVFKDEDIQALNEISRHRRALKSSIDVKTGLLKTGSAFELSQQLQKLDEFTNLSNSENVKEDLASFNSKHNTTFKTEDVKQNKLKVSSDFLNAVKKVEKEKGSTEAFKFLMSNGGIVFNNNFWDSLSENKNGLVNSIDTAIEELSLESNEAVEQLEINKEKIQELLDTKLNILKQYQLPNNPSEIDADNIDKPVKNLLLEVEESLQKLFLETNSILRNTSVESITDPIKISENTLNKSYFEMLADSNDSELDFIKDNITNFNKDRLTNFIKDVQRVEKFGGSLSRTHSRILQRLFEEQETTPESIEEILQEIGSEELILKYARTLVMPYFKRYAPLGYDTLLTKLKEGETSVSEFIEKLGSEQTEGVTRFLDISTRFSWMEDVSGENLLNPNYDENFEGGIRQPKLDTYLNDDFFEEFGINKQDYIDTKSLKATRNLDSFDLLSSIWDLKRKGLESYNELGRENIYKLPQVSQGIVESTKQFLTKSPAKTIGNKLKDLIYNRVDELAYGEQIDGENLKDISSVRLVPKYYNRNLEEATDLSNEFAHTMSLYLQAAYTYEQRINSVAEVNILEQQLLKKAQDNNVDAKKAGIDMFQDFRDAYFFGITRSRSFSVPLPNGKKLDIAKLLIGVDNYVRRKNIGFSLPVAITSLFTGEIFFRMESYIGEFVNTNSVKWSSKEFLKLSKDLISDVGKIKRDSKLQLLGEKFKVYGILERTRTSGFNRILRSMNSVEFKFSEMGNFPIIPRVMLSVLDNHRLVEGKFIDFNTFKQRPNIQELSKKDKIDKWNELRDNSMYNSLTTENGKAEFKPELIEEYGLENLEKQLNFVQGRVQELIANVDGIVPEDDKSAATRDFLMRFTTAHRGWLAIALQRRFKRKHFNFITGQVEEGHYRTFSTLVSNVFSTMEEKNIKGLIKSLKENYHQLDDTGKRNIKRIMVDLSSYMFLLGFGILVASAVDDDDNKDNWAIQFLGYNYFRTVNELGSSQAPSGLFDLVDTIQTPFIALNSVKEVLDVKGFSLDEVSSGNFEGHSRFYKKLAKQTWLRHLYELRDPKGKSDAYRFYNSETLMHLSN